MLSGILKTAEGLLAGANKFLQEARKEGRTAIAERRLREKAQRS